MEQHPNGNTKLDGRVLSHTSTSSRRMGLLSSAILRSREKNIHRETDVRFLRAGSAPVCQGAIFDFLGSKVDTETTMDILEGRFDYSVITDKPTWHILEEIANIWKRYWEMKKLTSHHHHFFSCRCKFSFTMLLLAS